MLFKFNEFKKLQKRYELENAYSDDEITELPIKTRINE
jgi:hypothetical protein